LAAAAEKVGGAENPPEKNAAGRISAEDKNAAVAGFFSGPFSAVVQSVHVHCVIRINYAMPAFNARQNKPSLTLSQTTSFVMKRSKYLQFS
jgi:hypothetical protein